MPAFIIKLSFYNCLGYLSEKQHQYSLSIEYSLSSKLDSACTTPKKVARITLIHYCEIYFLLWFFAFVSLCFHQPLNYRNPKSNTVKYCIKIHL